MDQQRRAVAAAFDLVDPRSPDARVALAGYAAELDGRFPEGFDPGDEDAVLDAMRPPDGAFLVVRGAGAVLGCGGLQRIDARTAEVKRMWIAPGWRGLGLGRQLLARLEETARELGRSRVVLDTNDELVEAVALYERAGYRAVERYNDNPHAQRWYAKALHGIT